MARLVQRIPLILIFLSPMMAILTLMPAANARPLPTNDSAYFKSRTNGENKMIVARIDAAADLSAYFTKLLVRPYIDPLGRQAVIGEVTELQFAQLQSHPAVHDIKLLEQSNQVTSPGEFEELAPPLSEAEQEKRLAALRGDQRLNRRSLPPTTADFAQLGWWDAEAGHQFQAAWANGFTGAGVTVMTNDSGADFCHPDLIDTWATVEEPTSPYFGYPMMFDSYSMYLYAFDVGLGDTRVADGEADYADTSATCAAGNCVYQPISSTVPHNYVLPLTSLSGVYHIGSHPDGSFVSLYGERVAVLVTDENAAGVYDNVYIDLDNDYDFTDEMPANRSTPIACLDFWDSVAAAPGSDGYNDISGGLIYFISDGITPIPASDWMWNGLTPANGELVAFAIADPTSLAGWHGQSVTSNVVAQGIVNGNAPPIKPPYSGASDGVVVGGAPGAKVTLNGNTYETPFVEDAFLFAALGYDGLPNSADDIQIIVNSWGDSTIFNGGWNNESRLIEEILRNYENLSAVFSTGNGGAGYGGSIAPIPPGALKVGASSQSGSIGVFDSITSTSQILAGDLASLSNRGVGANGGMGVDILANGDAGTGLKVLNDPNLLDGWMASHAWRGSSRSVPVAAAGLALVYQAGKAADPTKWLTAQEAQAILKLGATTNHNDPFSQGAGNLNALNAVNIAAGLNGFKMLPASWQAGGYGETSSPAFASIVEPGEQYTQSFTLQNDNDYSIQVSFSPQQMKRFGELILPLTTTLAAESPQSLYGRPDYLIDISNLIPVNTELLQIEAIYPYEQFDVDNNYFQEQRWWLRALNWSDINGDGDLWTDVDGNGAVNDGEIDDWEYLRFTYDYATNNTQAVQVKQPLARMTDGIFVAFTHIQRKNIHPTTSLSIRLSFYESAPWDWLTLDTSSLLMPANSSNSINATLTIPDDAPYGSYSGAILAEGNGQSTMIPIAANVAATTLPATFGGTPRADTLYDNGYLSGRFNWSYRPEAGDWRSFFLDVPAANGETNGALIIHDRWEGGYPTDIDTLVFAPSPDSYSQQEPDYFGPYSLGKAAASADTLIGRGKYAFETVTNSNEEWLTVPITTGLHLLRQHQTLAAGDHFQIPFTLTVGSISALPASVEQISCHISGTIPISIVTDLPLAGLTAAVYGLNQPQSLPGLVVQDGPNPATASLTTTIAITDGGLLRATLLEKAPGLEQLDLYLLYDANDDGVFDWTDGAEFVDWLPNAGIGDSLILSRPADGDYLAAIHGKKVSTGGEATLQIAALQGQDGVTVTGAPGSAIPAQTTPLSLNWAKDLTPNSRWEGIIFLSVPYLLDILSIPFVIAGAPTMYFPPNGGAPHCQIYLPIVSNAPG